MGATCANGNLYCPATPTTLLQLQPLARGASAEQTARHDQQCAELARYKLSPITRHDPDGYHRAICPAAQGKLRCPLRPESMTRSHDRPSILAPPQHPPACCQQKTITVPPPSTPRPPRSTTPPHRSTAPPKPPLRRRTHLRHVKDPATNNLTKAGADHWPHRHRAPHRHRPHRPQPAHQRRPRRPPSRERTTRRQPAPTQTTQAPPPDHRRTIAAAHPPP